MRASSTSPKVGERTGSSDQVEPCENPRVGTARLAKVLRIVANWYRNPMRPKPGRPVGSKVETFQAGSPAGQIAAWTVEMSMRQQIHSSKVPSAMARRRPKPLT
ncbi:hypothetical protein [Ensifer sp. ENS11]|uniref:hypothetical protein n=1 Tax=Ensifer sp. ENS11 TaxID=2769291 RepID=UPI002811AD22|nr:hypothetical protein [Ensifer sp. ENS11]